MSDAVWVLGAAMTKVGRYPDRDLIDLACEAALASLTGAGLTMRDAGIYEIATHLRGEAGERQIQGAKAGLAHVIGYGWNASVHILEKGAA